jgi:hypothetical protein
MTSLKAITAAFILVSAAAHAQPAPAPPHTALGFGLGSTVSCASWLSNPVTLDRGRSWILGLWSGLNAVNSFVLPAGAGEVGHSTDAFGIVSEVEVVCRAAPSLLLGAAAEQVYVRLRDANR